MRRVIRIAPAPSPSPEGEGGKHTQPSRRKIARDAVKPHAIGPVGVDRHIEHRIGLRIIGKARANGRIGGEFDNPVMIVTQLQLARRTHHAVAFYPAHGSDLEHHAVRRNHRAGQAQHADEARARIGCAADDGERQAPVDLGACIDSEHLQLVRIGMAAGGEHPGYAETGELVRRVFDPLNLKPHGVKLGGNLRHTRIGFEEIFEPGKRELHNAAPTARKKIVRAEARRRGGR